jgi:hypothetical protein
VLDIALVDTHLLETWRLRNSPQKNTKGRAKHGIPLAGLYINRKIELYLSACAFFADEHGFPRLLKGFALPFIS